MMANRKNTDQSRKVLELIYNNTYVQNINKGAVVSPTNEYFGATTQAGMAYPRESLYNKPNTMHADMTKSQSNYMNPKQAKVI
tara:strand:+ start:47 stop:295 length:249 start_codon:yes stop_codon:yes gene_type:complete